jgi:hypothetical protein
LLFKFLDFRFAQSPSRQDSSHHRRANFPRHALLNPDFAKSPGCAVSFRRALTLSSGRPSVERQNHLWRHGKFRQAPCPYPPKLQYSSPAAQILAHSLPPPTFPSSTTATRFSVFLLPCYPDPFYLHALSGRAKLVEGRSVSPTQETHTPRRREAREKHKSRGKRKGG